MRNRHLLIVIVGLGLCLRPVLAENEKNEPSASHEAARPIDSSHESGRRMESRLIRNRAKTPANGPEARRLISTKESAFMPRSFTGVGFRNPLMPANAPSAMHSFQDGPNAVKNESTHLHPEGPPAPVPGSRSSNRLPTGAEHNRAPVATGVISGGSFAAPHHTAALDGTAFKHKP